MQHVQWDWHSILPYLPGQYLPPGYDLLLHLPNRVLLLGQCLSGLHVAVLQLPDHSFDLFVLHQCVLPAGVVVRE